MNIETEKLESLVSSVCEHVRLSVRQSTESVVRESRQRLARNPADVGALHVVAASSLRRNPRQTLDILSKKPELLQQDPVANRLAGYAWLAQEQDDLARQSFDQSVRLDPCQADCWTLLGKIAERTGQADSAIEYYQRAIAFEDDQHESALALSKLYASNQSMEDAIHTLRVCLFRDRRSPKLNLALAKLLSRRAQVMGRRRNRRGEIRLLHESLGCYQTANAGAPTSRTLVAQGLLQKRLELFEDARVSFQQAVEVDATSSTAITQLANVNVDCGNIEEAVVQFQSALTLDPENAATHFRYTRAQKFKQSEESQQYADSLAELCKQTQRPDQERVQLHFALAKVLDDMGQYDLAWQHYDQANRLKPGHTQSQAKRKRPRATSAKQPLKRLTADSIRLFTPEFFADNQGIGNPSATPVFIVGMPRSGTTLTEQILSSHPEIAGGGELKLIDQIRRELGNRNNPLSVSNPNRVAYPDLLQTVGQYNFRELADHYLLQLDKFRTIEARVTDKMPTNFMHLGMIAMLFPNATIVHCRRNPMDVLVSCYSQNLSAPFCDLEQLVHYHRNYRRKMEHWQNVLPLEIHTVDYESMVADPETNSRALIEHCGLEWDERCLKFHDNRRAVHTPSKWQVRQPMYSSSVEKWRRFEKQLSLIADRVHGELGDS